MPATAGTYEFRLFVNNARAATSPPVTVDPSINAVPVITSLSPAAYPAGLGAFTLTVNGKSFVAGSIVRWNGSPRSTTFVNATQLRAAIGGADVTALGTAQVTVFTPAPGGGTSTASTFAVVPLPSLAVSSTTVVAGSPATVTLTGGLGGSMDWIALAETTSPDTRFIQYTYVGKNVTTRSWTVNMPATPGMYEFRLFLSSGMTRAATSPRVTVSPGPPVLTSLSPPGAATGSASFTLTATGSGFSAQSVVNWNGAPRPTTYVNATQLRAAIAAADVAAPGTAQIAVVTPAGTSGSLPFTIETPALTVSTTSVQAGADVTVTLANGPGGSGDWLAFALSSAANSSYVQRTSVGTGITARTWTIAAPLLGGTYEFRLFTNNSFTRVATSAPITVIATTTPALTVDVTAAHPGDPVTVTLTNGFGGSGDWLALASATAPNNTYLKYAYVGAGVTSRTWTVTMPSFTGAYEFRLFVNGGFTLAARSPIVSVSP
jgi:hypothetical protein